MEAIVLHATPGRPCVTLLSSLLVAAPIAYGVAFGGASLLRGTSDGPIAAQADEARTQPDKREPATTQPAWITKASLPSLPVPRLQRAIAPSRAAEVQRVINTDGIVLTAAAFATPNGIPFQLEGLKFPDTGSRCRRLDGVDVSCHERIAARLEILARSHPIRCRIVQNGDTGIGRCFSGKLDVAEDLARAGLVLKDPRVAI